MLASELRDRVLSALGFSNLPTADHEGLARIYEAWCRHVPFDNIQKLIHVGAGNPGPLPGSTAEDFFESWLRHRTGGTCWAGNGALCALLQSVGFDAHRGVATMLVVPTVPPNHGTVIARFYGDDNISRFRDGEHRLVDASILHLKPLPLEKIEKQTFPFGVTVELKDGKWTIRWTPAHLPNGLDCRVEYFPTDDADFQTRHEATREWSPFNYLLSVRTLRGQCAVGVYGAEWYQISTAAQVEKRSLTTRERAELLVNQLGFSEEIVSRLPEDQPIPPPPGSATASRAL